MYCACLGVFMSSWSIAQSNLTSVGVLAFIFGFLASRVKSDVRLPEAIYSFLSIYLLFGIGLKGGHSLKSSSISDLLTPAVATIICGTLIPLLAFAILKFIKGLSDIDRGSISAHYGSTSLVTFSAAILFLESNSIFVEGFAPALLTLMEIPGLIVGIYLASRSMSTKVGWAATMKRDPSNSTRHGPMKRASSTARARSRFMGFPRALHFLTPPRRMVSG